MACIIIHQGQAHRDEFIACAILMAHEGSMPIYRREPTEEELNDPNVWVIDTGKQLDSTKHNFDHHQSRELPAAYQLVAKHFGIYELCRNIYSWWDVMSTMDTNLFAVPKSMGMKNEDFFKLIDPIGSFVIRMLEDMVLGDLVDTHVTDIIHQFGRDIVSYARKVEKRVNQLNTEVTYTEHNGVKIAINPIAEDPTLGSQVWLEKLASKPGVIISHDDRGNGWSLYRVQDHPQVDFNRVKNNSNITFAHPGGFIAKTTSIPVEQALELVKLAIA